MKDRDAYRIQQILEDCERNEYEFGGVRVYHNGNINLNAIEKFYRHAPHYVTTLLRIINELEERIDELERDTA